MPSDPFPPHSPLSSPVPFSSLQVNMTQSRPLRGPHCSGFSGNLRPLCHADVFPPWAGPWGLSGYWDPLSRARAFLLLSLEAGTMSCHSSVPHPWSSVMALCISCSVNMPKGWLVGCGVTDKGRPRFWRRLCPKRGRYLPKITKLQWILYVLIAVLSKCSIYSGMKLDIP